MSDNSAAQDWPHTFIPGTGPVVLALHGTGGTEADAAPLAQTLLPQAAVIAPRGRVLEQGLSRWFRREAEGVFDVDDVIKQALLLNDFIVTITREHGLKDRPVITIGFSNGANMGLALAMLRPETVHTAVAFSGMYPFGNKDTPHDLSQSRFLLANGHSDAMAPRSSVNRLIDQLHLRHAHVDHRLRRGGHGITPDELITARDWLTGLYPHRS